MWQSRKNNGCWTHIGRPNEYNCLIRGHFTISTSASSAWRRIAEKTGRGVVCLISNYSWLDGLSFTGMRERYLEAFDVIRIDCLNSDKYKTGKTAPDGSPDPSIFSTQDDPVGIQVGTAISTLVRKADHTHAEAVGFRHLWGQAKLSELTDSAEAGPETLYDTI